MTISSSLASMAVVGEGEGSTAFFKEMLNDYYHIRLNNLSAFLPQICEI
jgi:hypothetical protein